MEVADGNAEAPVHRRGEEIEVKLEIGFPFVFFPFRINSKQWKQFHTFYEHRKLPKQPVELLLSINFIVALKSHPLLYSREKTNNDR